MSCPACENLDQGIGGYNQMEHFGFCMPSGNYNFHECNFNNYMVCEYGEPCYEVSKMEMEWLLRSHKLDENIGISMRELKCTRNYLYGFLLKNEVENGDTYELIHACEILDDIFIGLIYNETKEEYYFRKSTNRLIRIGPFSANNKFKILSNKFRAPGQFWNSITL